MAKKKDNKMTVETAMKELMTAIVTLTELLDVNILDLIATPDVMKDLVEDTVDVEALLKELDTIDLKEMAISFDIKTRGVKSQALIKTLLKEDATELIEYLKEGTTEEEVAEEEAVEEGEDSFSDKDITAFIAECEDADEIKEIAKAAGITTARRQVKSIKKDLNSQLAEARKAMATLGYFEGAESAENEPVEEAAQENAIDAEGITEELAKYELDELKEVAQENEIKVLKRDTAAKVIAKIVKALEAGDVTEEDIFGDDEGSDESESCAFTSEEIEDFLKEELDLDELKEVAKELNVKVTARDKEAKVASKIMDSVDTLDVYDALVALDFLEGNE